MELARPKDYVTAWVSRWSAYLEELPHLTDVPLDLAGPRARVSAWVNRWFPDRQVLLRGPGKYSVLNLPQNLQLIAASALSLLFLWLFSATVSFALNYRAAHQAAMTTQQLKDELAAAQARINALNAAYASAAAVRDQQLAQAALSTNEAQARANQIVQVNATALDVLCAQTQDSIQQVQAIIKATGLDPNRLARHTEAGRRPAKLAGLTPDNTARAQELLSELHQLNALTAVLTQVPLTAPVDYMQISSPFGYRPDPWTGAREFHVGIDLRGAMGTPVTATAPGTVTFAGYSTGYGELIVIDHGFGLTTRYSHLERMLVRVGQHVTLHQEIGLLGDTGWSTGPHLLYETRVDGMPQNPLNFIKVASNDVQN